MARSRRHELGVGILLAVTLVLLAWMALQIGAIDGFGPTIRVDVRTRDAAGLQVGAVVLVAGVKVGEVEGLGLDHDTALVRVTLDPDAGLRTDAAVRIRARSILGEKYLEVVPASADAPLLADGDQLVVAREQVELDEMVDSVGPLLRALDPEALGAALEAVSGALAEDPERVARMLRHADAILDDGAVAADRLPALLERAEATLAGVDRATATLQRRLEEAKAPIAKASDVLDDVRAASAPLDEAVAEARAALGDVRSVAGRADALLADVEGVGPDLKRLVSNFADVDKWELRRLLREEGILIRLHPREVAQAAAP